MLSVTFFASAQTTQSVMSEAQKIDALISHVERLKDAVFIRNGAEYSCADAADHMRTKRRNAGSRIKTAIDFIELAASKSSVSGKPYLIRFSDGRELESGPYLKGVLASLETPAAKPAN
jgi:hypothetical protein